MCLCCYRVLCGRYVMEHMLFHNIETSHPLALSFSDLSVWCYSCESYIDNSQLHLYKNLAHRHKFGEDMQWSYDDDHHHPHHRQHKTINSDSEDDSTTDNSDSLQQNNYYIQLNFDSNN